MVISCGVTWGANTSLHTAEALHPHASHCYIYYNVSGVIVSGMEKCSPDLMKMMEKCSSDLCNLMEKCNFAVSEHFHVCYIGR